MNRVVNQIRPKGDPTAAPYSPQRDLANIYLPMLREVFTSLDEKNWSPYMQELFSHEGVTEEQLGTTVTMFVEAHRLFVRDREVHSPADAFGKAGVAELPNAVRMALFARLGEVVTGGFFIALRDVTMQGQVAPCHSDLVETIAAGRELAQRLHGGDLPKYDVGDHERLLADAEETARALAQAHAELEATRRDKFSIQSERDSYSQRLEGNLNLINAVQNVQCGKRWYQRVWRLWKLAVRIYRNQV